MPRPKNPKGDTLSDPSAPPSYKARMMKKKTQRTSRKIGKSKKRG